MPVEYKTLNNVEIKSNRLDNNEEQLEDLKERKTDYSSPLFVPLYAQISVLIKFNYFKIL